ncbi:MAG: STAS domain-containing protein [Actinobacteria bacterium]|nr:STAS domain-containing protein [Actinomycetota bacterium]
MGGASLSTASHGDTLVITISGDLDIVSSPELDDRLTKAGGRHARVILDLTAVTFLDTSALAVIVGHWKTAQAAGRTLALAGANYRYTKALWVTGLADKMTMFDTLAQGLAARPKAAG